MSNFASAKINRDAIHAPYKLENIKSINNQINKEMKRVLPAFAVAMLMILTGCRPSPEKLAEKMASGEQLSEKEYTQVLEYTLDVLDVINDSIDAHKGDFRGMVRSIKTIAATYPESDIIVKRLQMTDPSTLDEKNRALYEKLMKGIDQMGESMAASGPVFRESDLRRIETNGADNKPDSTVSSKSDAELKNPTDDSLIVDHSIGSEGIRRVHGLPR